MQPLKVAPPHLPDLNMLLCVLTRHVEPREVREGVEVAGSAPSAHRGHHLSVQRAI